MGLLECASGTSAWRGYEYHQDRRVTNIKKIGEQVYSGTVQGQGGSLYSTQIDLEHPRKSSCDCPHADGKRIICKHMIALYFTVYPTRATEYHNNVFEAEQQADKEQQELEEIIINRVYTMKKAELAEALLRLLFEGPEWQFDRFVREHFEWDK